MSSAESVFFWLAALGLAASFFLSLLSIIFKRRAALSNSFYPLLIAFAALTLFGIIRWVSSGHPPFVTLFESMIASVWFICLIFIIVRLSAPQTALLALPLSLVTFLLMGWSSSLPAEATPLSEALDNVWLFIHASFATSGAASFLVAASFAGIYLMGEERLKSMDTIAAKVPEFNSLLKSVLNFMLFGLILWGVMIISGSIWAHGAWGRYWAWDPIELWSLLSWMLYGLILHARLTFKMSGRTFCKLTIAAALTVVFALWGVGYLYNTIHNYG